MTKLEINLKMKDKLGKRVLITGANHPWRGEVGTVKEFDILAGKPACIIEIDNNSVECAVYSGHDLKFLEP